MRDYHFEPYDRLQAAGLSVEAANYNLIYTAELTPGTSLEDIFTRFNIDHPADFRGHSLSVSDIVVLHQNGHDTAHYVDSFGYKEVPEFLQEQTQQPEKENRHLCTILTGLRSAKGNVFTLRPNSSRWIWHSYLFHMRRISAMYKIRLFIMNPNGVAPIAAVTACLL